MVELRDASATLSRARAHRRAHGFAGSPAV